jgi:hypothetical protein
MKILTIYLLLLALSNGAQAEEVRTSLCPDGETVCLNGACKRAPGSEVFQCDCDLPADGDDAESCQVKASDTCQDAAVSERPSLLRKETHVGFCVNQGRCRQNYDGKTFCECNDAAYVGPHCELSVARRLQATNSSSAPTASPNAPDVSVPTASPNALDVSVPTASPTQSLYPTVTALPTESTYPTGSIYPTGSALPTYSTLSPTGAPASDTNSTNSTLAPTGAPANDTNSINSTLAPTGAPAVTLTPTRAPALAPTSQPVPKPTSKPVPAPGPHSTPKPTRRPHTSPSRPTPPPTDGTEELATGAAVGIILMVVVLLFFACICFCRQRSSDAYSNTSTGDLELSTNYRDSDEGNWQNRAPLTSGIDDRDLI